ncbi:MAG: ATP-binding cassette domain-containing protein [Desulfitobacteriia bacterium]
MSLEIKNLAFAYDREPIFENVSLNVEKGEVVCLLGPNGSGKTTLFKTILGLYIDPAKVKLSSTAKTSAIAVGGNWLK